MLKPLAALAAAVALAAPLGRAAAADREPGAGTDAETATVADASARVEADVWVDGASYGRRVLRLSGGDVVLSAADARAFRLPVAAGDAPVALARLAPGVTYRFDDVALTLAISVAPTLLGTTRTDVEQRRPPPGVDASRPPSAFGDYFVSAASGGGVTGSFEGALAAHDSELVSSASAGSGEPLVRGATYYAHDSVARLRREQAGDVTVYGDSLVGDLRLLGVGVRRAFELDPYLFRFPTPTVAGVVAGPAVADVYVDGVKSRSVPLAPGGFTLSQLPIAAGDNAVRIVVRDSAGNVQSFDRTFFETDSLLRPGLSDFQFAAGLLGDASPGAGYSSPALAGTYRLGVSGSLTAGGRLELASAASVAELEADAAVPRGALHVAVARGAAPGTSGGAFDLAAVESSRSLTLSAEVAARAAGYRDPAIRLAPGASGATVAAAAGLASAAIGAYAPELALEALEAPRSTARFALSQSLGRSISLNLSSSHLTYTALPSQSILAASVDAPLDARTTLFLTAQDLRAGGGAATHGLGVSLVRSLGAGDTLVASGGSGPGAPATVQLQHAAPSVDDGFGYVASLARAGGAGDEATLALVDHGRYGDVSLYAARFPGGGLPATLSVAGGVVAIGGVTSIGRPVRSGFALVTTGAPGVPIVLDGRPVGSTDARGRLIVGTVQANAANRFSIDPSALPLDEQVGTDERLASPGVGGGSIVRLGVARLTYVTGGIALDSRGARVLPVGGTLELSGGAASPLDDDGRFYFEDLAPGTYRGTLRSPLGACSVAIVVPRSARIGQDLGETVCAAR